MGQGESRAEEPGPCRRLRSRKSVTCQQPRGKLVNTNTKNNSFSKGNAGRATASKGNTLFTFGACRVRVCILGTRKRRCLEVKGAPDIPTNEQRRALKMVQHMARGKDIYFQEEL